MDAVLKAAGLKKYYGKGEALVKALDGVDLSSATTKTYESNYVEDDAEAGETLGMSTDDLTTNATGSGEAETVTEEPAAETPAEDSAEVPADSTGEPVADDPEAVG